MSFCLFVCLFCRLESNVSPLDPLWIDSQVNVAGGGKGKGLVDKTSLKKKKRNNRNSVAGGYGGSSNTG